MSAAPRQFIVHLVSTNAAIWFKRIISARTSSPKSPGFPMAKNAI
jgi:hypothetical protein